MDATEPLHYTRVAELGKSITIDGDIAINCTLVAGSKVRIDLTLFGKVATRKRASRLVGVRRKPRKE